MWAYLESIFVGSEDIRKQLPHETKMFEGVNDMFISNMATMHASSPYPLKNFSKFIFANFLFVNTIYDDLILLALN